MRIGIIGLPNSGKTTLFNLLTGGSAPVTTHAGAGFHVNAAVAPVPDARVDWLAELYRPKKTTHARVEYTDIAGLGGTSESGAVSLAGEVLNAIGTNDALLHVVRAFPDAGVPHPLGSVDPLRDMARLEEELVLADLAKVENRLEKLAASLKRGKAIPTFAEDAEEHALLSRLQPNLAAGRPLRSEPMSPAEEKRLRGFQLLSRKPILVVFNLGDSGDPPNALPEQPGRSSLWIRARLELDLARLEPAERTEFMSEFGVDGLKSDAVVRESYRLLDRMTFFTVGDDEVRAWEVPARATALECAGAIHTDLARGFIRAEVVTYVDLVAAGSHAAAKAAGRVRLEGKDYRVQDGDILLIRFNI